MNADRTNLLQLDDLRHPHLFHRKIEQRTAEKRSSVYVPTGPGSANQRSLFGWITTRSALSVPAEPVWTRRNSRVMKNSMALHNASGAAAAHGRDARVYNSDRVIRRVKPNVPLRIIRQTSLVSNS